MDKILKCKEIICKSALNSVKERFPYRWDLNVYRGCEHKCRYCYAVYSHKYIDDNNFFDDIYVKTNIVEMLEKELRARSWKQEIINLGGVTDNYQAAEANYEIMPEILKLLIKYKTPAIISTKSNLILRDIELIDKLSRITSINIAATITTADEALAKRIEPNASTPKERFEVLKEFRRYTNASVGLHDMPIVPYLTDSYDNLDELYRRAKECNVHYVIPGLLNLRGETKKVFLNFVYNTYYELYSDIVRLYKDGKLDREYKLKMYARITELTNKHSLSRDYMKVINERIDKSSYCGQQLNLFDTK